MNGNNKALVELEESLLVSIVKDLENTRDKYSGYAYIRTIRNILVGKEDAIIAPHFKECIYYGIYGGLRLDEVEDKMNRLVIKGKLNIIYTEHGKLYCTHEYYKEQKRK